MKEAIFFILGCIFSLVIIVGLIFMTEQVITCECDCSDINSTETNSSGRKVILGVGEPNMVSVT